MGRGGDPGRARDLRPAEKGEVLRQVEGLHQVEPQALVEQVVRTRAGGQKRPGGPGVGHLPHQNRAALP